MNAVKAIAELAPLGQSVALAVESSKMIKKEKEESKQSFKKLTKGFTKIMVGLPLIRATSAQVAKL